MHSLRKWDCPAGSDVFNTQYRIIRKQWNELITQLILFFNNGISIALLDPFSFINVPLAQGSATLVTIANVIFFLKIFRNKKHGLSKDNVKMSISWYDTWIPIIWSLQKLYAPWQYSTSQKLNSQTVQRAGGNFPSSRSLVLQDEAPFRSHHVPQRPYIRKFMLGWKATVENVQQGSL